MIPDALVWRIQQLRQPRLLQPICPNMLDWDGLPSSSLLAGVDALLAEDALQQIGAWEMPADLLIGRSREDRWRTVSSLQKAIRRGDVRAAMDAAHAAYGMDPGYLLKRVIVCAVEDVMLGNLYAVSATLALAGDRASRRLAGEQKTLVWLAAQLASGWKDRTACNLCVVVDFNRALHPTMREWARLPDTDLAGKAADMGRRAEERMLAAWLLAGTKRYWNVNVPTDNDRPRGSLMRLMVESRMPLLLYWLADRAATRGGDCLFVSVLPIWQLLRDERAELELRSNQPTSGPNLDGLLMAAYDMHTREGQAALRRLAGVPSVADILARIQNPEDRLPALFAGVFIVEGGQLALRVSTPKIDQLHFGAIHTELDFLGLAQLHDRCALLQAIADNLGALNGYRLDVAKRLRRSPSLHPMKFPDGQTTSPSQLPLGLSQVPKQLPAASLPIPPNFYPAQADRSVWEPGNILRPIEKPS